MKTLIIVLCIASSAAAQEYMYCRNWSDDDLDHLDKQLIESIETVIKQVQIHENHSIEIVQRIESSQGYIHNQTQIQEIDL
jgi:hypothetical protein